MDDDEPSQKLVEGSVMNPLDWREKWKRGPDTFPLNYQGRNEWKSCRGRRNGKAASKGIILHRNGDYISTKLRVLLLLWWVYDHAKRNHPSLPDPSYGNDHIKIHAATRPPIHRARKTN